MTKTSGASHKLARLLWLLALVPPVTMGLVEWKKTFLIWHIRIVDFTDLVVLAPFYLIVFLLIQSVIFEKKQGRLFWIAVGLIGLFLYGHAMHLTANAINTYSTEIHNYQSQIPPDTYEMIYFFDEDLGHWILFAALFGLMGVWLYAEDLVDPSLWKTAIPGIMVGLVQSVTIIESSHPWIGLIAFAYLAVIVGLRVQIRRESLIDIWRQRPLARFVMVAGLSILLGELIYLAVTGGFVEPSQMGY
jgi:hypothetical protein